MLCHMLYYRGLKKANPHLELILNVYLYVTLEIQAQGS